MVTDEVSAEREAAVHKALREAGMPMEAMMFASVVQGMIEAPPYLVLWMHTIHVFASSMMLAEVQEDGKPVGGIVAEIAGIPGLLRQSADILEQTFDKAKN